MITIRKLERGDKETVLAMMRTFYASPAVHTDGSAEIFQADVEACLDSAPFLEGYVFRQQETTVGYAMVARSFSTEYGRPCLWIEDLYLIPQCRGKGAASRFFVRLQEENPGAILRLEVEEENVRAVRVYEKNGFDRMPYTEMKKLV